MTDDRARRIRATRNRVRPDSATADDEGAEEAEAGGETDGANDGRRDNQPVHEQGQTDTQPAGTNTQPTGETQPASNSQNTQPAGRQTQPAGNGHNTQPANGQTHETPSAPQATGMTAAGGGATDGMAVPQISGDVDGSPTVDASVMEAEMDTAQAAIAGGATERAGDVFADGNALISAAHNDEDTVQVLEFFLSGDRYAIAIDRISAIVKMKQITRFPRGPDAVDGVTDLRGEITAVIDPTQLLSVEHCPLSSDHYIVVLEREGESQKLGIRVTNVSHAVTYHESKIERSEEGASLTGHEHEFVKGIIKAADGEEKSLIAWLDVDAIISVLE